MQVLFLRPPLFEKIDAAFHIAGRPVLFAWGDVIYNPLRVKISDALFAHEAVHGERQGDDVEGWWHRYIADPRFRFEEELPAHVAEWRAVRGDASFDRRDRRLMFNAIAKRLSGPLYGGIVNYEKARQLLKEAA